MENDLTSPSISTLCDILSALGTDLSEFFKKEVDEKVVFGGEDFIEKQDDGMLWKWIIPNAQKNIMEPVLVELLAGASTSVDFPHEVSSSKTFLTSINSIIFSFVFII